MRVFIKEWPNKTATILTANGQVVWTFSSAAEARQACHDWRSIVYAGKDDCYDRAGEYADVSCSLA
jgi:hypothetical protein